MHTRNDDKRLSGRPAATRRSSIGPRLRPGIVALIAVLFILSSAASAAASERRPTSPGSTGVTPPVVAAKPLEGVDVSKWQDFNLGAINWAQVAAAGKSFAIVKATQGWGYVDPNYATNYAAAKAAGLKITAYHFAAPDSTAGEAIREADHFVDTAGLVDGDLIPALDLEVTGGLSVSALQAWVASWLGEVNLRLGIKPMIYTSPSFWSTKMGDTTAFADAGYNLLWIAHWGVTSPTVPAKNWGGKGWTFWQYTSTGTVAGITGSVDLDRYNGTDLGPVTYHPSFSLATSPASVSVKQGASVASTVALTRTNFPDDVAMTVSGLPAAASAVISPNPATNATSAAPTVTTKATTSTPTGTYPLTITGTGGGLTRTTSVNLIVTDGVAPTVAMLGPVVPPGAHLGKTTTPMRISWSGVDPSGVATFHVQRQVNGGPWKTVALKTPTTVSFIDTLTIGARYRYRMSATDRAGNTSGWTTGRAFGALLVQNSNRAVRYTGTWHTVTSSTASGGTLRYSTTRAATTSYTFSASTIAWVAYRGPNRGQARIYLDGVLKTTVDLRATTVVNRPLVVAFGWGFNAKHTIKVVVVGTSRRPRVDSDAFLKLPMY
jgi:GH25 family lysozyme M1 (1,4-beta-N-acetylmuramidase)